MARAVLGGRVEVRFGIQGLVHKEHFLLAGFTQDLGL